MNERAWEYLGVPGSTWEYLGVPMGVLVWNEEYLYGWEYL
jgi:hypothetical protein